ncbi:MAG: folate family ECF transporter S component [Ruminococcaceae bacterium]|nr:folate family ECF transporter S component [Oscillospiraceae bacterium]
MQKQIISTKALAYCAMFTALSVVFARLIGLMPNESMRFSIEAVPIFLAGMLFGPVLGGCVGFAADFIGCLFSPFGYNPIFCIPPILYGVFAGLLSPWLRQKCSLVRLTVAFLLPVVLGSLLYQSATLAYMYYKDGPFFAGFVYYLSTRAVQFAITLVADVAVVYLLLKSRLLERVGLWNTGKEEKK